MQSKHQFNEGIFSVQAVLAALQTSVHVLKWGIGTLIAIYAFSGITIVKPHEVAIIVRLGIPLKSIHQPGLLFAFPQPFDRVVRVPKQSIQEIFLNEWLPAQEQISDSTLHPINNPYTLTGDIDIIRARFVVHFQVSDPLLYAFSAAENQSILQRTLYHAAAISLAGMSVDDALTTGKESLAEQCLRLAQENIDSLELGIHLLSFEVREISPPSAVSYAFQDVISAAMDARTVVESAKAYQASTLPHAIGEAYEIEQQAESYTGETIAQARGKASAFKLLAIKYTQYPALTEIRLYNNMLQEVLPKIRVSTVMASTQKPIRLLIAPNKADEVEVPEGVAGSQSSHDINDAPSAENGDASPQL